MANLEQTSLISRVLSIEDPSGLDPDETISKAYESITGGIIPPGELEKRRKASLEAMNTKSDRDLYQLPAEDVETSVALLALYGIFKDRTTFGTVLTDWPLYQKLYETHVDPTDSQSDRKALLLGALSALSMRAFTLLAREVYHIDQAYTIDLNSSQAKKRPENGTFLYGDALHLPFQTDTMDIIQSNQLLHMIVTDGNERVPDGATEENEAMNRLFEESHRVLKPGGHVIMREPVRRDPENTDHTTPYNRERLQLFGAAVSSTLRSVGFETMHIAPAPRPKGVDYLFDPARQFDKYPAEISSALAIVARKPRP